MKTISVHQLKQPAILQEVITVLRQGGLILFPTETTYGAGVLATHQAAVDTLLAYKARREGKPLSIAVADQAMAEQYVDVNDSARRLYQRFLPGPVTVVSQSLNRVAQGVASEFGTLGVRIPAYPPILKLVRELGEPITATSANASGEKRPYSIAEVMEGLSARQKDLISLVIDAGTLPPNEPSTVIDTTLSTPTTLREGTIQAGTSLSQVSLTSNNEQETKAIAQRLQLKNWEKLKTKGLVIALEGSLGMGKTVFAKGVADFLQITTPLRSPTYTYLEEYPFERHGIRGTLYHMDVWKIDTEAEWQGLGGARLLEPRALLLIEWYSQVQTWFDPVLTQLAIPKIGVTFSQPQPANNTVRQLAIVQ